MLKGLGFVIDGGTYLGLVICVTLLVFIFIMRSFDRGLRKDFVKLVIVTMVALFMAAIDMEMASFDYEVKLRYITKIVKFTCEGYMMTSVLQIVKKDLSIKARRILQIPFIITTIVLLTAPFNKNVFYFTADNHYVRGWMGLIIFIEAAIYYILAYKVCIDKWKAGYQRDAFTIFFMLTVIIVGVILEEKHVFANCCLTSSAVGIHFLYMYMYAERYNVDSVSKCFKRRCFYSDANKHSKSNMAVISMDLNDLKLINDNYGHKAGDIALLTFAEVCRAVKTSKFNLYRTGGDEFMMLGVKASDIEAEELVDRIRQKLKETPYTCSFGIQMYTPGDDFDAVVVEADKAMYDDKRTYKASTTKRSHSRPDAIDENMEFYRNNTNFLG